MPDALPFSHVRARRWLLGAFAVVFWSGQAWALSRTVAVRAVPALDVVAERWWSVLGLFLLHIAWLAWAIPRVHEAPRAASPTVESAPGAPSASAGSRRHLFVMLWAFLVSVSFWSAWSRPETIASALEIALRVGPFVLPTLLVAAGMDAWIRAAPRPVPPLHAWALFLLTMIVLGWTLSAFSSIDRVWEAQGGYAGKAESMVQVLLASAPVLLLLSGVFGIVVWSAARDAAKRETAASGA